MENINSILIGATSLFMLSVAIIDLGTRRVPLWLTLPAMIGAIVYQLWWGGNITGLIIAWGVAFLMWKLKLYGGGDAKVLMALFGFYPLLSLAWAQVAVSLSVAVPWLLFKYRHQLQKSMVTVGTMAVTGNIFPATRGYRKNGHPVIWVYALGWLLWLVVYQ